MKSAKELDGATVCVQPGTSTELAIADYFRDNNMKFTPVLIEDLAEIQNAFLSGRCDAYSTDSSALAGVPLPAGRNKDDFVLLPEIISKEPLGPMVRKGDDKWFDIVRWTYFAQLHRRGRRRHQQERRPAMNTHQPGRSAACSGVEGDLGKALGRRQQVGLQRRSSRSAISARSGTATSRVARRAARHQQSVEQGRPAIRAADALIPTRGADARPPPRRAGDGRSARRERGCSREPIWHADTVCSWRRLLPALRSLPCPVPSLDPRLHPEPRRHRDKRMRLSWSDPRFRNIVWQVVDRRRRGGDRLVSGRQHQPQPRGAAHRHRVRLPRPHRRHPDRRDADPLRPVGQHLWPRAADRHAQHPEGGGGRHRAGDASSAR